MMNDRKLFAAIAFSLFSVITLSVFYLFTMSRDVVDLAFAYVAGISMIVLPCTLPLVFVIVPLSMGKGYKKGFWMAVLFGLGLSVTLALYGVFVGAMGSVLGLDVAMEQAGLFSRILFMVGGVVAFVFGLSELGLFKLEMPAYSRTPGFIEKRKDYSKAFLLGLFLGNAGVGCPNPLFYILLGDIAIKGAGTGALLGLVHGIGRATPLIFLSILGIMGINVTPKLAKNRAKMQSAIGWSLVVLGIVIFLLGGAHGFYEQTVVHRGWNGLVKAMGLPSELMRNIEEHEEAADILPPWSIPLVAIGGLALPWILRRWKGDGNRPGV